MSLIERIRALAETVAKSENEFATKVLGYKSNSSYNSIISKGNPRYKALKNIIEKTGVNAMWLMTGQGEMFNAHLKSQGPQTIAHTNAHPNAHPNAHLNPQKPIIEHGPMSHWSFPLDEETAAAQNPATKEPDKFLQVVLGLQQQLTKITNLLEDEKEEHKETKRKLEACQKTKKSVGAGR